MTALVQCLLSFDSCFVVDVLPAALMYTVCLVNLQGLGTTRKQNRRQKVFNRGPLRCAGGLTF